MAGEALTEFRSCFCTWARPGGGQLVVQDIVGRANVRKPGGRPTYDARGTRVGTVTYNGEPQAFPGTRVIEIPGVARLERKVVERRRRGISTVAVRVTMLDGSLATIDVGVASIGTTHSGP